MKQFKKIVAMLIMASCAVGVVGCGNTIDLSKVENNQEVVSTIALSNEEIDVETFTLKAPEGWEHTIDTTVDSVILKGENSNEITAVFIPMSETKGIDVKEYVEEVEKQLVAEMKENFDIQLTSEVITLSVGDAGVFTTEVPFTSQSIQGWLASGSLTQAQIDEAGGEEEFIGKTKITLIQTHILTDKGMFMVVAQSINGEEGIKEYSNAVANTIVLK